MKKLLTIFLICLSSVNAGELKDTWEKIITAYKAGDKETALKHATGDRVKTLQRWKWDLVKQRTSSVTFEFVSEYVDKEGKTGFVVTKVNDRAGTNIFIKEEGVWKLSETTSKTISNEQESKRWKQAKALNERIIYPLKTIGVKTASYFADGDKTVIPHHDKMKIQKEELILTSPENGEKIKVLMCEGFTYWGSDEKVIGILSKPVYGKYYAVWEDAYAGEIPKKDFKTAVQELKLSKTKDVKERSKFPRKDFN